MDRQQQQEKKKKTLEKKRSLFVSIKTASLLKTKTKKKSIEKK